MRKLRWGALGRLSDGVSSEQRSEVWKSKPCEGLERGILVIGSHTKSPGQE